MVTVNELKMLKVKALSTHPWHQSNVGRVVSRIRREFGVDAWTQVSDQLQQARETKDTSLLEKTIEPLIAQLVQQDLDKKAEEKRAILLAEEQKKQELAILAAKERQREAAAKFVSLSGFNSAKTTVVVRRAKKD